MSLIGLKGIEWKSVKIPKGRTQKACMHVISKMREAIRANKGADTDGVEFGSPKKPGSPRKKGGAKRKKANEYGTSDDDGGEEVTQDASEEEEEAELTDHEQGPRKKSKSKTRKVKVGDDTVAIKAENDMDVIKAEDVGDN